VTALSRYDFVTENIGDYETVSECYFASTQMFWENMPMNKEAVCMRVEEHRLAE
jgi:predicted RNA-binding protein